MAGESDGSQRVSDAEPTENDSKSILYIGAAVVVFAAFAVYAIIYRTYIKR